MFPGRGEREGVYERPDWAGVHRELARVGVTLRIPCLCSMFFRRCGHVVFRGVGGWFPA